jgi:hypothetical protein
MHNMPKSRTNFDAVRHWCGTSTGLTCSKSESLSGPAVPSCRVQGRLTQLPLASLGLSCPDGLPANLSGLSALQTLDWAFNNPPSQSSVVLESCKRRSRLFGDGHATGRRPAVECASHGLDWSDCALWYWQLAINLLGINHPSCFAFFLMSCRVV